MSNDRTPRDNSDDPTILTPSRRGERPGPLPDGRAPKRPTELAVGHELGGRFRITRAIGKGGMGLVYLADDARAGRAVALKTVPSGADAMLEARFRLEAQLIAKLRHPNIVELVDFGEADGLLYLAMEFIDGEPLTQLLEREGALGTERAIAIALQLAEALVVAHALGVVHRDIKPDNIMIKRTADGRDVVKVLDFGVAKLKKVTSDLNVAIQTTAGSIVGSLRYITPEQVDNEEVTPRTDMYLFGCVLYELLTGRRVFDHKVPSDCAIAHLVEVPKPPVVPGVTLPRALVDFVMRCLAKKPSARPADARAAVTALRGR